MDERLKNIIFISICEASILYYNENKGFSTFDKWCNYYGYFISNELSGDQIPKGTFKIQFYIIDYLDLIYGFSDEESLPLIIEFFKNELWNDFYDVAEFTLNIQQSKSF